MVKVFRNILGVKLVLKKFRGEPFDVKSVALQIDIGCSLNYPHLSETEYGNVYCCVCVCVFCVCVVCAYMRCVSVLCVCYVCAMCVLCV